MHIKFFLVRSFHTCTSFCKKVVPRNLKGKGVSSSQWLTRQLTDPYVEKAKLMNYRCRSAFKLIEMDDRFHFFNYGQIVIDCGASPGSWTQVAVKRVNSEGLEVDSPCGTVIAVDKQQIFPIQGATILGNSDFTHSATQDKILQVLNNRRADIVLSDMAPSATGIRELDNENVLDLCYCVLRFAALISNVNATLIVKLWQCNQTKSLENDIGRFYHSVKTVKPNSSRSDSAEMFLLGRNFKGLKANS